MSQLFSLPLISLACICTIMAGVWAWATKIKNYGIVDVFWALNFLVIALFILSLANGNPARKLLVAIPVILWSIRLSLHLGIRIFSHIQEEEGRYKQLRTEWAKNLNAKFFAFFQMQAFSNVFLSIPFFIIAVNKNETISVLEYISVAFWIVCIAGEGIADLQLKNFKQDPANKGKVCDVGLWNYSRHPNYFFQLMIWISVLLFALSSPHGWLAIVSPLSIGYLLFKVTGIPMTEEQALRSKGDAYKQYQQTTSVFIPWFKKK